MKKAAHQRRGRLLTRIITLVGIALVAAALLNVVYYFAVLGGSAIPLPAPGLATSSRTTTTRTGGRRELDAGSHSRDAAASVDKTNGGEDAAVAEAAAGKATLSLVMPATWPTRTPTATLLCVDVDSTCNARQRAGKCMGNLTTTLDTCKSACFSCEALASEVTEAMGVSTLASGHMECADADEGCAQQSGLCATNLDLALAHCKATCKLCDPSAVADNAAAVAAAAALAAAAGVPTGGAEALPTRSTSSLVSCRDDLDVCPLWAGRLQQCAVHWWMPQLCKKSCGICSLVPGVMRNLADLHVLAEPGECADYHVQCAQWSGSGMCKTGRSQAFMAMHCSRSCNSCNREKDAKQLAIHPRMQLGYLATGVAKLSSFMDVGHNNLTVPCSDNNAQCSGWAALGECTKNGQYMNTTCPRSCRMCAATSWLPIPLAQVRLNNGVLMPSIGYGSAGLGDITDMSVSLALASGYRHIDTAQATEWYREDLVGQAISASGVARSTLFLTSKLHPKHHGFQSTLDQFEVSLKALRTEYLDLFLLHYPECWAALPGCPAAGAAGAPPPGAWQESWRALERLYAEGKVRAIGISNFDTKQAQDLLGVATVKPAVLQVHVDPFASSLELREWCAANGVQLVGYSTLGTQWGLTGQAQANPVLTNPVIVQLAMRLQRSAAQVVLRWALQLGVLVIPRSSNGVRMVENRLLWDFALTEEHMLTLGKLEGQHPPR